MHLPILLATEFLPIDLTQLVGISMSLLLVLIPVIGATIRFAAKPFVESLIKLGVGSSFGAGQVGDGREVGLVARRVLELEQEVAKLKGLPARPNGQLMAVADVAGEVVADEGQRQASMVGSKRA